jgi:hypothetical protein
MDPAEDRCETILDDLKELKVLIAAHYKNHRINYPSMDPRSAKLPPPWYDDERDSWVVDFETGNNTGWSLPNNTPKGWEVEERTGGNFDGDEQYIMYKPKVEIGK